MKRILLSILILTASFTVSAQRLPILPDITALKAFTGTQVEVLVVDVNTGGKFATSTSINAETADEFDIYAGAGGRKWKRVSKIGPPDTLYTVRPLIVKPRGTGRRIDTLTIKTDTGIFQPSGITGLIDEGTNVTITGTGTIADPYVISATGGGESGVASFNSRIGAVSPATNDYTWAQINKTTSSLADITTRSAADLSSGTLSDSRLSSNVPLLTGSQTFSGVKSFSAGLIITGGSSALGLYDQTDNHETTIYRNADVLYMNARQDNLSFRTPIQMSLSAPASSFVFTSSGTLGIGGITSPNSWFHAPASTTSLAGITLPHGSAPSSPVNGQFWTTTSGAFARINGATHRLDNDTAGTYSPSVSGSGPNVDGVTAAGFTFTRIDNIVEVSGRLTVDLSGVFSGGLIPINIPLPISSALANVYDVTGEVNAVSNSASNNAAGWVEADTSNDRATASIYIPAGSADPRDLIVRFRYVVQ